MERRARFVSGAPADVVRLCAQWGRMTEPEAETAARAARIAEAHAQQALTTRLVEILAKHAMTEGVSAQERRVDAIRLAHSASSAVLLGGCGRIGRQSQARQADPSTSGRARHAQSTYAGHPSSCGATVPGHRDRGGRPVALRRKPLSQHLRLSALVRQSAEHALTLEKEDGGEGAPDPGRWTGRLRLSRWPAETFGSAAGVSPPL